MIKSNQNAWLKPYIDINTDLKEKQKVISKKIFLSWHIMHFLEKTMKNVSKNREIKLVTTARRRNYLVSEPSFHNTKFFIENLLGIEMKITEILLIKPFYLGLSILELIKILMYEFWRDYVKPKYGKKAKLCYMDTNSFTVYIKQMIFMKTLHKKLKPDLILQILS